MPLPIIGYQIVSIGDIKPSIRLSERKQVPYFECSFESINTERYYQRFYLSESGLKYPNMMLNVCNLKKKELKEARDLINELSRMGITNYTIRDPYVSMNSTHLLEKLFNLLNLQKFLINIKFHWYDDPIEGKQKKGYQIVDYYKYPENSNDL